MAMSRKHYTETAAVITNVREDAKTVDGATRMLAEGLARMFKADNSNFNREKFMDACGLGDPNGN